VLRALAELPIMPAEQAKTRRHAEWIGSGPYRVAANDARGVTLERVDDYWGVAPAVQTIVFARYDDAAAVMRAAKSGELDIVPRVIPLHYPEQLEAPGIRDQFSEVRLGPAELSYLALNTRSPPLDDSRVRQALAHLIDHESLEESDGTMWRPVSGPIWPGGPGDGAAAPPPHFDMAQASSLLHKAGWSDSNGDGVRERGGLRLMVTVLATDSGADRERRQVVLDAMRKAGFVVDLRIGTPAVLKNRLRDGEFAMAFLHLRSMQDVDLGDLFQSGGALNYGRYRNAEVDALLGRLRAAQNASGRANLLASLAKRLRTDQPLVALAAADPRSLVHRRVGGMKVTNGWFFIPDLFLASQQE
jgi:peptide/nickel transport system substrate-binding protein